MRLLDLFCCAGGASEGYHRAGFDVVGVDIAPQPRYPFEFVQADALDVLAGVTFVDWPYLDEFDAIHASPPCQAFSNAQRIQKREHPELVGPTRALLEATGLPYVIENVVGAPLLDPVRLEGTMFAGIKTLRPRLFETNWPMEAPPVLYKARRHAKMGRQPGDGEWMHVVGNFSNVEAGRRALGMHWGTRDTLREAIPPAYTEYVGWELRTHLLREAA